MKHIASLIALYCLLLFSISCSSDTTFLITENSIGPLERTSHFDDIQTIFSNDSIVKDTFNSKIAETAKKIKVYEKGGKHLLTLKASQDSIPKIENIRVFDERYISNKKVGLNSTFKDIQDNYEIKKIVTTIQSIVIFLKDSNMYFTIDKAELPSNLRYTNTTIEAIQIPDDAKIKYLMIGWE